MIAGLDHLTRGQIWLGGRDVTWTKAAERNVGLVFQSYALFPHMTVFDNVAFPLTVRRLPKPEIRARVDKERSEEHTSELQSLMRISYAVFCLKKKQQDVPIRRFHHNSPDNTSSDNQTQS